MIARVELLPQFRRDVIEQYCWYGEQLDEELAQRFRTAVTETIAFIQNHPDAGPICLIPDKTLAGIHFFRIKPPFEKWLLFYRVVDDHLHVVRLLHGMRDLPRRLKEK